MLALTAYSQRDLLENELKTWNQAFSYTHPWEIAKAVVEQADFIINLTWLFGLDVSLATVQAGKRTECQ